MADFGCGLAIKSLNSLFSPLRSEEQKAELRERLLAGEMFSDMVLELVRKEFGEKSTRLKAVERVIGNWPADHLAVVQAFLVSRAIQNDAEAMPISWKGDADHPETVTRFELFEDRIQIEFAHPPMALRRPLSA